MRTTHKLNFSFSLAALIASASAAAQEQTDKPPIAIARQGNFLVGGGYDTSHPDQPWVGQMYVQYQIPAELNHPYPIVFVHGGAQTGQRWWETPDGREGWAQFFVRRGYGVYVVDQVGRGRSGYPYQFWPEMSSQSLDFILRRALGTEDGENWLWPQAHLHTQWPGEKRPGDPVFDHNYMGAVPSMEDRQPQREMNVAALNALFDRIGEAILVVHSQSGAYGWPVVQQRPNLVKALIALTTIRWCPMALPIRRSNMFPRSPILPNSRSKKPRPNRPVMSAAGSRRHQRAAWPIWIKPRSSSSAGRRPFTSPIITAPCAIWSRRGFSPTSTISARWACTATAIP